MLKRRAYEATDYTIFEAGYVVLATNVVVKRPRLRRKSHRRADLAGFNSLYEAIWRCAGSKGRELNALIDFCTDVVDLGDCEEFQLIQITNRSLPHNVELERVHAVLHHPYSRIFHVRVAPEMDTDGAGLSCHVLVAAW